MPNGDPDFAHTTLPQLEALFAPLSEACHRFAKRHNIKIQKYYHEFPAWSFLFRHPAGGIGKIDLVKKSETTIGIWQYWWYDDYDRATRSIKTKEHAPFSVNDAQVATELESALTNILNWKFGDWDDVHGGYESSWHSTCTKTQFNALDEQYPVLKE